MNVKRKEAALNKLAKWKEKEPSLTDDDLKQLLEQDDEHGMYPKDEVEEIMGSWTGLLTIPVSSGTTTITLPALGPTEQTKPARFIYPEYDLWKVDVEHLKADKENNPKQVKFTAIKKMRPNVKLEHTAAADLNTQSHNSLRRYYLTGSITNGNEEIVAIF
jgi:vancomycin resistance protein YoaR